MKKIHNTLIYIFAVTYLLFGPSVAHANYPISGTFIIPDITYKSESEYRQFFQELQDTGINTIIFLLSSNLHKNCTTGIYTEEINTRLYAGNPPFLPIAVKLAKEFGMTMFFDVAYTDVSPCFNFAQGTLGDESTDKGKLIGFSLRTLPQLKAFISDLGLSWNDPQIAGFYIMPESDTRTLVDSNSPQFIFYKELSDAIKVREPNKKILLSPYQYEEADYLTSKNAFLNLLQSTTIDILAPQDSIGTGVTKTFSRSTDHFRGLQDALTVHKNDNPNSKKEVWANIETFGTPGGNNFVNYLPGNIDRVIDQIKATQPYVSRMIMYIYTHTMLSNPLSDNIASINIYAPYYTPERAVLRKALRSAYVDHYGPPAKNMYYYLLNSSSCTQTTSLYRDVSSCNYNLRYYFPNRTTEVCYASLSSCQTSTQSHPGDLNADGRVDIFDFNLLVSKFGNPYTIFNYNAIVGNFGK